MGYPGDEITAYWLNDSLLVEYPESNIDTCCEVKNPEIPVLNNYEIPADSDFWEKFPKNALPEKATTRINVKVFGKRIDGVRNKMTCTEIRRADRALSDLTIGACSCQLSELPPICSVNAKSAFENGALLTDTIATWVKKGFVAGPFETPPMAGFRANPLATVVRNGKVRPILNMSGPKGCSFNDNVDKTKLERLHMGTAKQFGQALLEAGNNAVFSKFDLQDAYKLMPAKPSDYRLQGFCWLGRYFIETQQGFGGVPSPGNFDRLAKTKDLVVCLENGTPRSQVFRALDDSPCVSRDGSGVVEKFTSGMKNLCEAANIPLAENCQKAEKAFELKKRGVVLGIGFDSSDLTWFLAERKADKVIRRCMDVANANHVDLKQIQKLMGSINDLGQMCPCIKFHKRGGNALLRAFGGNEAILKMVPAKLKEELQLVAKIADSAKKGLPIAEKPLKASLSTLIFYTDAAGASYSLVNGRRVFHNNENRGVSCIGGFDLEDIWIWTRLNWPEGLITGMKDDKGKSYGSKSTTLEAVGMLLPFVAFPDKVRGRRIEFKIDNIAVMFGWTSGYVTEDETASEILKAVHYLSGANGTTVSVQHVDRVSNKMATLADELSRKEVSDCRRSAKALSEAEFRVTSGFLLEWLKNPRSGGELCRGLVKNLHLL